MKIPEKMQRKATAAGKKRGRWAAGEGERQRGKEQENAGGSEG